MKVTIARCLPRGRILTAKEIEISDSWSNRWADADLHQWFRVDLTEIRRRKSTAQPTKHCWVFLSGESGEGERTGERKPWERKPSGQVTPTGDPVSPALPTHTSHLCSLPGPGLRADAGSCSYRRRCRFFHLFKMLTCSCPAARRWRSGLARQAVKCLLRSGPEGGRRETKRENPRHGMPWG